MSQFASSSFDAERLSDEEFEALVQNLQRRLTQIDELPESLRNQVFSLLNDLDRMHREALVRIIEQLSQDSPQLHERLAKDRAIQTLLLLYELSPELEAGAAKEAQNPLISLEGGNDG